MESLLGASVSMVPSHKHNRTGIFKLQRQSNIQFPSSFGVIRVRSPSGFSESLSLVFGSWRSPHHLNQLADVSEHLQMQAAPRPFCRNLLTPFELQPPRCSAEIKLMQG